MSESLILGIDVGTTAVKVAAFTPQGSLVGVHTRGYGISRPRPGWAEQDPLEWWEACRIGIEAVVSGLPTAAVKSVGVVSQVNTHVFVDEDLRPVAPAITWQDQRCDEIASRLDARFTPEEKIAIWGGPFVLDASFLVARATWFAHHESEKWSRTRWVLSPKDFITAKLTGRIATDGLSSIGLVDAVGTNYISEVAGLVDGLAERLPPLRDLTSPLGQVTQPDLRLGSAVVAVGTMDAFGDVFGAGVTQAGRAMISCGTSVIVAGASDQAIPTAGVITFPPRYGLFVHAGPTQAGGDALRWWSRTCGLRTEDVLAEAAGAPAGSSGVIFTPHLMGERAPLWDSAVRGSFFGLSSATARRDMSRAVLEGVAMSARQILSTVEMAGGKPMETIAFSGGGARNEHWAQIFADVLGRPVERLRIRDSAVLGAAILGSVGVGIHRSIESAVDQAVKVERTFHPDEANVVLLEPLYGAYTASYHALKEVHAALAAWRSRPVDAGTPGPRGHPYPAGHRD